MFLLGLVVELYEYPFLYASMLLISIYLETF